MSAKIYGETIDELPRDLFIPPEALELVLEAFEGPLDLLLYLIKKHSLNVLDIPMAELTRQYVGYIEHSVNGLAAEYLLMAAVLTEIKSRMLLPRPASIEEEEDPRAELMRRLVEYESMKLASMALGEIETEGRDFVWAHALFERNEEQKFAAVEMADLKAAWMSLLNRAKMNRHHKIGREELSVREHMSRILKMLNQKEYMLFESLFDVDSGISHLVVAFLAMLELAKEGMIAIFQAEAFGPIHVKSRNEIH